MRGGGELWLCPLWRLDVQGLLEDDLVELLLGPHSEQEVA